MKLSRLAIKQRLVGTELGRALDRARWLGQSWQRFRHPELWDMYLDQYRTTVALAKLIGPDFNCLDVGSHVGSSLVELVRLAPRGRHVAIEPAPEKAASLERRFPHVRVINAAVSDKSGTASFFQAKESGYSSLRRPIDQELVGEIPVEVVRLDDVIDGKVDFMKLDVEGAELPALRGAEMLLDRDQPIIVFECGPHGHSDSLGYRRVDLYDHLRDRGYDIYSMADFVYARPPMSRAEFDKAGYYPYPGFNFLAIPPRLAVTRLL
jgi:FkbM family methyltransferase